MQNHKSPTHYHIVGHRGYPQKYPENTLLSLHQAILAGALYIEFDVQLSRDGVVFLLHDDTLQRTAAQKGLATAMSWDDLQQINVGEQQRFGETFENEKIPTLSEVVTLLQKYPEVTAFLEIKEESVTQFGLQTLMTAILEDIKPLTEQIIIIAEQREVLEAIKKQSTLAIGWVIHEYSENSYQNACTLQPDYLICNYQRIKSNPLWQGNWQWMLYDITDKALACEYFKKGALFIETWDVRRLL